MTKIDYNAKNFCKEQKEPTAKDFVMSWQCVMLKHCCFYRTIINYDNNKKLIGEDIKYKENKRFLLVFVRIMHQKMRRIARLR